MKIGQILLKQQEITTEQLAVALWIQDKWGGILGRILHSRGYVTEETLLEALSLQLEIPVIYLGKKKIPRLILNTIDKSMCEAHLVLPFAKDPETDVLKIAIANPRNFHTVNLLKKELKQPFRLFLVGFIDLTNSMWHNFKSRSKTGQLFINKAQNTWNSSETTSQSEQDIISEIPVGSSSSRFPAESDGYEVLEEENLSEKYNKLVENLSSNHKPDFHMDLSVAEMAEMSFDEDENTSNPDLQISDDDDVEEVQISDDDDVEEVQISDDDDVEELQISDNDEVEELQISDDDEVEELLEENEDLTYEEIDISKTAEIKIIEDNQKLPRKTNKSQNSADQTENKNSDSTEN